MEGKRQESSEEKSVTVPLAARDQAGRGLWVTRMFTGASAKDNFSTVVRKKARV